MQDALIRELRADTPGCAQLIHFNNAGASLCPQPVMDALLGHLQLEQRIGGYEAQQQAAEAEENFYQAFARLLNCKPAEIAYAENATRAWSLLFNAIPFRAGDRILTGQSEYASNYLALMHLARTRQVRIEVIPSNAQGQICPQQLEAAIGDDVRLIALTHLPSQSGVIQPADEIGRIARRHGILFLLDACQSAGQMPLDVNALGCDMITGTGRKFLRGPRGTGFLYVRESALARLEPAFIDLHSAQWLDEEHYRFRDDARRFEVWENYVAGKIALGRAADYALAVGLEAIERRVQELARSLRAQLASIPGVQIHEQGEPLSGIVSFSRQDVPAQVLHQVLLEHGINTSIARRSSAVLDFGRRQLGDINRASVHYFNTEEEIGRFCQVLDQKKII